VRSHSILSQFALVYEKLKFLIQVVQEGCSSLCWLHFFAVFWLIYSLSY